MEAQPNEANYEIVNFKEEKVYSINSDNKIYNLNIKNFNSFILFYCFYIFEDNKYEFEKKYLLEEFKNNKYFSICESIDEVYSQLKIEFGKNLTEIKENNEDIIIIIPINYFKIKDITFKLSKKIKNVKEIIEDLKDEILFLKKENKSLKDSIVNLNKDNKILFEKISNLEKMIEDNIIINHEQNWQIPMSNNDEAMQQQIMQQQMMQQQMLQEQMQNILINQKLYFLGNRVKEEWDHL